MWPNARIGVMGGQQAANVLAQVKKDNMQRTGQVWPENEVNKILPCYIQLGVENDSIGKNLFLIYG